MKILSTKQEARLEKKKKKMAALSEIIKLNDKDRQRQQRADDGVSISSDESVTAVDIVTIDAAGGDQAEPSRKRFKIDGNSGEQATDLLNSTDEPISHEKYVEMKNALNSRKRSARLIPKFHLRLFGDSALLSVNEKVRTPIFLTDIQHLIMAAVMGSKSPCFPTRWCHLEKSSRVSKTVVVVVEGLSLYQYTSHESLFKNCSSIFEHKVEIVMPPHSDGQIAEELINVSLAESQRDEFIQKYGSVEAAVELTKNQVSCFKSIFPISEQKSKEQIQLVQEKEQTEVICRTKLLLSALQMVDEGYPIPLRGELANRFRDFRLTRDSYEPVTPTSPMFGVDCEMCFTSVGKNELTRISIVNEKYESIYETLVRPENRITDYLTMYSGITAAMLKNVTKTLREVQEDVRKLFPADAILVGQSLQSDLMAMEMMHPYVIDTSMIFNLSGDRVRKTKLKMLTLKFLGEVIQDSALGHDSIEDSVSSLKLAKLKLLKGIEFGDAILTNVNNRNARSVLEPEKPIEQKDRTIKSTLIVSTTDETNAEYQKFIDNPAKQTHIKCLQAENNKQAIRFTREHSVEHDFITTHLKLTADKHLADTKIEKTLTKLDNWISSIWETVVPTNGLFVVLLSAGGVADGTTSKDSNSGVAMVNIKRNNFVRKNT